MVTTRIGIVVTHRDGTLSVIVERTSNNLTATANGIVLGSRVIDVGRLHLHTVRNNHRRIQGVVRKVDVVALYEAFSSTGRVVGDEILTVGYVPSRRSRGIPFDVGSLTGTLHVQHQTTFLNSQFGLYLGNALNLDFCEVTLNSTHGS